MSLAFRKILIPVDFSISTEVAIEKAIEVAEPSARIHLLHMQYYGYPGLSPGAYRFILPNEKRDYVEAVQKMEKWKDVIESSYKKVNVSYGIDNLNSVQHGIEKAVRTIDPSLIIVGKKSRYTWMPFMKLVNPVRLTKSIGKPVLVVRPGAIHNNLRKIILTIDPDMRSEKLDVIQAICRKNVVKVYLLSFANDMVHSSTLHKYILLKCYECIKAEGGHQIENAVIYGKTGQHQYFVSLRKWMGTWSLLKRVGNPRIHGGIYKYLRQLNHHQRSRC